MDFLSHFHSQNVYFYTHYSYSLNITSLSIFQKFRVDTNLNNCVLVLFCKHSITQWCSADSVLTTTYVKVTLHETDSLFVSIHIHDSF